MFKRVERKIKRKEKEEELGINEDMKEVLGIHDTDSDESDSESEDSSDAEEGEGEEEGRSSDEGTIPPPLKKRKRDNFEPEPEDQEESGMDEAPDEMDADQSDEDEEGVQMNVEEALNDPLYIVSIQPDVRACILCPDKLLKNPTMAEVHKTSQVGFCCLYTQAKDD
jgi:hypothetical protein